MITVEIYPCRECGTEFERTVRVDAPGFRHKLCPSCRMTRGDYWFLCEGCGHSFVNIAHAGPKRTHCGRCLAKVIGEEEARKVSEANVARGRERGATYAESMPGFHFMDSGEEPEVEDRSRDDRLFATRLCNGFRMMEGE